VVKFTARIAYDEPILRVEVPVGLRDAVHAVYARAVLRHGGYGALSVDTPRRPRTTGERSQNHHFNGHCQTIAVETGCSFDAVKAHIKRLAVDIGYPFDTLPDGTVAPKSEADASVEDAIKLIDAAHRFAAEYQIRLREGDDERC
jgi:hypothetical protein